MLSSVVFEQLLELLKSLFAEFFKPVVTFIDFHLKERCCSAWMSLQTGEYNIGKGRKEKQWPYDWNVGFGVGISYSYFWLFCRCPWENKSLSGLKAGHVQGHDDFYQQQRQQQDVLRWNSLSPAPEVFGWMYFPLSYRSVLARYSWPRAFQGKGETLLLLRGMSVTFLTVDIAGAEAVCHIKVVLGSNED